MRLTELHHERRNGVCLLCPTVQVSIRAEFQQQKINSFLTLYRTLIVQCKLVRCRNAYIEKTRVLLLYSLESMDGSLCKR